MSQKKYRETIIENILNLLWAQWSSIGVPSSKNTILNFNIDIEGLIIFSMHIARFDPRLFDEIVNWMYHYGDLINIQRLKNILKQYNFSGEYVLYAVSDLLSKKHKYYKWAKIKGNNKKAKESLFMKTNGEEYPIFGKRDEFFEKNGFLRGTFEFGQRGKLLVNRRENLSLKIRLFMGVNVRSEIINYLLLANNGTSTSIANKIYFYQRTVHEILNDMYDAQMIKMGKMGREKKYFLDKDKWYNFFEYRSENEYWIDWVRIYKGLDIIIKYLFEKVNKNKIYNEYKMLQVYNEFIKYINSSDFNYEGFEGQLLKKIKTLRKK